MNKKNKKTAIPRPTLDLTPDENRMYREICHHLQENNGLQKIDAHFIALTARAWRRCQDFEKELERQGAVQIFENGSTNVSGYYTALQRERDFFEKACRLLGMNVAAREKLLTFKADANEQGGIMRKLQNIREQSKKAV